MNTAEEVDGRTGENMMKKLIACSLGMMVVLVSLGLVGCEAPVAPMESSSTVSKRVTAANLDRVGRGMTVAELTYLLGNPIEKTKQYRTPYAKRVAPPNSEIWVFRGPELETTVLIRDGQIVSRYATVLQGTRLTEKPLPTYRRRR